MGRFVVLLSVMLSVLVSFAAPSLARPPLDAVVAVETKIPGTARLANVLGRDRSGSGVVIDESGLVLTVGYIMMEAQEATVTLVDGTRLPARYIAYDHETGFGLLKTLVPPNVTAAELGSASELGHGDVVTYVSGMEGGIFEKVAVVSRRPFAGYWEYLLDEPLFTVPALPGFAGAALFNEQDQLVGIGSLFARDASDDAETRPGNMAIPVDALMPVFADLLASGRRQADITPWTGMTLDDRHGFLIAVNISDEGPAEEAGLQRGDAIVALNGEPTPDLESYMRALRATGRPGTDVTLSVIRPQVGMQQVMVSTMDRMDWLRLNPSY